MEHEIIDVYPELPPIEVLTYRFVRSESNPDFGCTFVEDALDKVKVVDETLIVRDGRDVVLLDMGRVDGWTIRDVCLKNDKKLCVVRTRDGVWSVPVRPRMCQVCGFRFYYELRMTLRKRGPFHCQVCGVRLF